MNRQTTDRTAQQTGSSKAECCTELKCESGLRNNYFEGKRLTPDSFRVEQNYMLERRHLLNRAIHGWGVVFGYEITTSASESCKEGGSGRLKIGAGLALDECGRELLQTETLVEVGDVIFRNKKGAVIDPPKPSAGAGASQSQATNDSEKECWLLSVHYAEQYTRPVTVRDSCLCKHDEWDNTCETVRYSLRRISCAECCDDFDCELNCKCETGSCCGGSVDAHGQSQSAEGQPHQRGGCRCLCEHLTQWAPEAECGHLCEVENSCGRVRVDLRNGVPLACVDLVRDDCDGLAFGTKVESCGPRRLVKRNDLLFDLIRGCDLTRISDFGWKLWHRQGEAVTFERFSEAFGPGGGNEAEYVTRDFWVEFSRPVRRESVRRDCFVMTVITAERDDGWWETFRVPIVRVNVEPPDADLVHRATIVVSGPWLRGTVKSDSSLFQGKVTRIELEVRGDFIVDCNGQTVDANASGRSRVPPGNGAPGSSFLSTFLVAPAPQPPPSVSDDNEDSSKGVS